MEAGLISIIIPVYNVSEYLHKCVESVLRQTYTAWELLLVDDESTDGSERMCDEWAASDERIRVLHERHAGPAKTRNAGIEAARGEFVYLMDSDDWIEPDTLECLHTAMVRYDADIVSCGMFLDYPSRTKTVTYTKTDKVVSHEEALRLIVSNRLPSYLVLMLWRRSVVQEPFADVPCYEDYATGYKWFSHARRMVMLADAKYHYVQREGSIMHTSRLDKFLLEIYRERYDYIRQHQFVSDADNRSVTVRNLVKLAKDFARKPVPWEERIAFIGQIRDVLDDYLPVSLSQIGLKCCLRLRLLRVSVSLFVCVACLRPA